MIRDSSGTAIRVLGTNLDITNKILADEKIKQLKRRNQALLDNSPVCHKIIDLDLNLQYMNTNGFNMLQLPESNEWFGKPYPFSFFPESAKKQMLSKLSEVKSSKKSTEFEGSTCDSKGKSIWLHHNIMF